MDVEMTPDAARSFAASVARAADQADAQNGREQS